MFRTAVFCALLLAVNAYPSESSGSSGYEASAEETIDVIEILEDPSYRSKRDVEATSGDASGSGESGNATCTAMNECYNNGDCGSGSCLGAFLETCNCNACLNFWMCSSDSECGGLKGACQNGFCDCYGAYTKNNYTDVLDAFTRLCNVKSCTKESADESCAGLPCNKGFCVC